MSQIALILNTLASASVSSQGQSIRGLALATMVQRQTGVNLPVRLLSMMHQGMQGGSISQGGAQVAAVSFAGSLSVTWTVTDLCLMNTAGEGLGLQDYEPAIAAYMAGYVEMVRTRRVLIVSPQVTIIGASFAPGMYEWPQGSGDQYVGVETVLTVKEIS